VDTAFKVGKRHGKPVILEIEASRMAQEGFTFFVSDNDVWLAEVVPPRFLKQVE